MRVHPKIERAGYVMVAPIITDGLCDGHDMALGERTGERRATVPAGAKTHQLIGIVYFGFSLIVLPLQPTDIHQHSLRCGFICQLRGHSDSALLQPSFYLVRDGSSVSNHAASTRRARPSSRPCTASANCLRPGQARSSLRQRQGSIYLETGRSPAPRPMTMPNQSVPERHRRHRRWDALDISINFLSADQVIS